MKNLAVLGSTGSIGQSTLEVVRQNPESLHISALVANTNVAEMMKQIIEFEPEYALLVDEKAGQRLQAELNQSVEISHLKTQILVGNQALNQLVSMPEIDSVIAAIVGAAGLPSSMAAAKAGKQILLANKEALIMSGQIFIDTVKQNNAALLPVDSEHNAIFQSLPADYQKNYLNLDVTDFGVHSIILTGSGGPFLETPLAELAAKTPAQACKHPNWSMGQKISVDSATMMNKGLELIEACWLFGVKPEFIEVLLHPQSVIHSMVRYLDGSIMAQMGAPDMKTPIAHCLGFPNRIKSGSAHYDFINGPQFSFKQPDYQRYPNLRLASEAFSVGQEATTVLNAANEIHVQAFLDNKIRFTEIAQLNANVLNQYSPNQVSTIDCIMEIDTETRAIALQGLNKVGTH